MNETTRTLTFAGIAAVALVAAYFADRASQPVQLTGYENVGEEFYPDYTDPTEAKSLRVVSYNEDLATLKVFNVEFKNGAWIIPSHHDYPADAEDELAETATSLVGVVRGALESRRKSDHERFGVIDPLDDSNTNLKGRGQRLTLSKEGGVALVDFIIGKEVPEQPNEYYVRKVDEDAVYRTKLKVDLSSEFSDWIEPDILKVDRDRLVEILISHYSIDEAQQKIVYESDKPEENVTVLTRKNSTTPWEMQGLDKATQQLNTADVNQLVNTLTDLKLQGIRPKSGDLAAGLKQSGSLKPKTQLDLFDLQSKGFVLARGPQGTPRLASNEGEVVLATNQGVVYSLYFGEIFTGSTLDIEVGNSNKKEDEKSDEKQDDAKSSDAKPSEKAESENGNDSALKTSRYLLVTVSFDPSFLGDPPQKPEAPEKPAGLKEKPETEKNEQDKKETDKKDAQADEKPTPEAAYENAMKAYQSQLKTYERKLKEYDDKVVKGKEQAQELNERFADWYYVISANSFEALKLKRKALVEPIEKPKADPAKPGTATPPFGKPVFPPADKKPEPAPAKKPAPAKSEAQKPAPGQPEKDASATAKKPATGKPASKPESAPKETPPEPKSVTPPKN
ncbi:DUF4340 domain-containing protein [Gimesia algae]|uniref:DUF4340 domain-containing protein n=1 Tax=Gimesia algae TaxID=2527971 RepID=A0A517VCQ6_9PLAN|nr:DUF4340 domain-containing protein [Gimesia algae]QDT90770.1 hypothetical protein Pan161_24230 [Gimesia algae]